LAASLATLSKNYSETLVHFYPQDKRKIYRANKLLAKLEDNVDLEKLAEAVNKDVENNQKTTGNEIGNLIAAASTVSTDSTPPTMDPDTAVTEAVEKYAADQTTQPDNRYETAEAVAVLQESYRVLNPIETKLLRLKGIAITIEENV